MRWVELLLILVSMAAGAASFTNILWNRRVKHVWPKRGEVKIVNPGGLLPGIAEVMLQTRVIANRPWAGIFHVFFFYGFLTFGIKSTAHVVGGLLNTFIELPVFLVRTLDVAAGLVLAGTIFMAIRRYTVMRHRLTHMLESGIVLGLISLLMVTYLLEHLPAFHPMTGGVPGKAVWWVHFLILCGFPSLIAYGKHLHLIMGPVNVVLRHMTERPSDRPIGGGDFNMGDENSPEDHFEKEYGRVAMPNGVKDFSFHTLFDTTACIECGRCNDACPSKDAGLKPRDHFVLAFRDPATTSAQLAELAPPDTVATCTQCRACDTVCPVGNRPSKAGLELRGRMTFEGLYPPRALKDGGVGPVSATGNIFGEPPSTREKFVADHAFPIYDPAEHAVLLILGCQGGNSPDAQPVIVATAKLLDAAGVKYGVLAEESCWGEGLVHAGGLMEEWPMWKSERIESLTGAMGGDRGRTILTVCPHCRDSIAVQYAEAGASFSDVRSHIHYLKQLIDEGKLTVEKRPEAMAAHHPCKTIHNDESADMDALFAAAGVTASTAGDSPAIPRCCGGGGGGFLWDSPAKVNKNRFTQIMAETNQKVIATGCPGCHRMLNAARSEDAKVVDVATLLADRLPAAKAPDAK